MNSLKEQVDPNLEVIPGAPLWRRFLAILYDTLMVVCVVFIAWQPMPLLPFDQLPDWLSKGIRLSYMFLITFGFFGWFWTHGGQTIGMRAWKIRLVDYQALEADILKNPGWSQAFKHYLIALISWSLAGLGFFAALLHKERRTWHERGAGTAMVVQRKVKSA